MADPAGLGGMPQAMGIANRLRARNNKRFDLFAVEGGTAAIACIFRSLKANRLLRPGDRITLGTPFFTPCLEISELEDYGLEPVYLDAHLRVPSPPCRMMFTRTLAAP